MSKNRLKKLFPKIAGHAQFFMLSALISRASVSHFRRGTAVGQLWDKRDAETKHRIGQEAASHRVPSDSLQITEFFRVSFRNLIIFSFGFVHLSPLFNYVQ